MEPAIGCAKDAVCCICTELYEQINHLRGLGDDVSEMQRLLNAVKAGKVDINNRLELQGREAFEVVKNWMDEVDKMEKTVALLKGDYDLHKRCLFGCCPDCVFKLRLSSRVRACITSIQKLSEDGKFEALNGQLGEVPRATELVPVDQLVGQTPQKAQAVIEGWLADSKTRIIGIYGIGGIGKTSLVQTINNSPNLKSWFDVVIFVAVSQNADGNTVQNSIAGRLGLTLPESGDERSIKLFNYLQKKKYLLILDDLWEKIDLNKLGVGVPSRGGGSKIVLTTRDRRVCTNMEADESLELQALSPEEGWELFCGKALLDDRVVSMAIEDIAKALAARCGGLPLAINCIAAAMRDENDIRRWEAALNRLASVHDTLDRGLPDHLNRLKLSYDFLPPHLKPCFLDCALYRCTISFLSFASRNYSARLEDKAIDAKYRLIPMWIAEGLLVGGDRDDLYDMGCRFINDMRDRGLIQPIDSTLTGRCGWVKVHDVLHDLAIQIGKMENTCLYGGGSNEIDLVCKKAEIVRYERISLVDTEMVSLPTDFKSHTLISLVLRGNRRLQKIPEGFLINLPSLKALELSRTNIESVPSSLGLLKQLVYLSLSSTKIEGLPESIGHLTCLQFLDLCYCDELTSLPVSISDLKSLKSLLLQGCEKLSVFRREISLLTSLERLTMDESDIFIGEGSAEMEDNEICMKALVNFRRLRELSLQVKSPIVKGLMGSWINMRELWLDCSHTNQEDLPEDVQVMNQLEVFVLENCNAIRLPDWICKFKHLNFLRFRGCLQLTDVSELRSLPSLRVLVIGGCNSLRGLEVGGGSVRGFPMLQHLYLIGLPSLETLVGPSLEGGVMPNLKQLVVRDCDGLRTLPSGMEKLQKLEEIRGSQGWWDGIVCESDRVKNHFNKFYVEWAD